MNQISLTNTYTNRHILLLGGLGFLGKILLVMFLKKLPDIEQIYLVLRSTPPQTAQDRFIDCVQTSPVFGVLREQFGKQFLDCVKKKVTILDGDVSKPHFGIESKERVAELQKNVDLVINSAGLVTFNPDFLEGFRSNVLGTIHAAEFVKQSKKGALLHVSTCFVAGNVSGMIPEKLRANVSPSGMPFDAREEIERWTQNTSHPNELNQVAIERVRALGWPNIYTYTKALAEAWLATQKEAIRFTIVRPSILESTLAFPFPGWNEGFNTTAPLLKFGESGVRFLVGKRDSILDVLPIDICCAQMVKIGALLLLGRASVVYQCGTSSENPLFLDKVLALTSQRYGNKLRMIDIDHPLSCFSTYALFSKIPNWIVRKSRFLRKKIKTMHNFCKLTEILLPFIYYNKYIFASDLVEKIEVTDPDWETNYSQIKWNDYWINIHLPGLEKWCFPKIEE